MAPPRRLNSRGCPSLSHKQSYFVPPIETTKPIYFFVHRSLRIPTSSHDGLPAAQHNSEKEGHFSSPSPNVCLSLPRTQPIQWIRYKVNRIIRTFLHSAVGPVGRRQSKSKSTVCKEHKMRVWVEKCGAGMEKDVKADTWRGGVRTAEQKLSIPGDQINRGLPGGTAPLSPGMQLGQEEQRNHGLASDVLSNLHGDHRENLWLCGLVSLSLPIS